MTRKITVVTAILALLVGSAVAAPHEKQAPAGYAGAHWTTSDSAPNGDFQLQGR